MRQIGMALRMYADDFDGEMPRTSHSHAGSPVVWVMSLSPYVANAHALRACPADQRADEIKGTVGTSYVLNEYVAEPQVGIDGAPVADPETFTGLDNVPRPSETIMLFELSDEKARDGYWDHTHSRSWFVPTNAQFRWEWILSEIEVDRHRPGQIAFAPQVSNQARRRAYDRTQGVANYLYCDAHVKAIPARQIKGWADANINFAKPPR
jgi:prepilin-type processing-associated H-X9-DG protein